MELKFAEIDENEHYWTKYSQDLPPEKSTKKIAFDDILTNMNVVVNNKGVLQFIGAKNNYHEKEQEKDQNQEQNQKYSYIYNKYFKDYSKSNVEKIQTRIPKTKEEYYQMLAEERIQQSQMKKYLEIAKPKKLLLTTNDHNSGFMKTNITTSKNNLFKMNFK